MTIDVYSAMVDWSAGGLELESWMGTGFTGPSSLGRGQRPCLAAGVCWYDKLESWMDTGFTGQSSLERGQRPCLAAGMCRYDGTMIGLALVALVHLSPSSQALRLLNHMA